MTRADLSPPRAMRLLVALAVVALHLALVAALIRAFAPDFTARMADSVLGTVTVTITAPPPAAAPPLASPSAQAAAAPPGKKAVARPITAPSPRIVIAERAAPAVAGTGSADSTGARDSGIASGAGGEGRGAGSGQGGSGNGGGAVRKPEKIAGEINSARDYPAATRELRLGDHVVIALTVGVDGRVKACRVHRPSRDPQADQVTCRLALDRFRFRPALDAAGDPVEAIYGWQQRWFGP